MNPPAGFVKDPTVSAQGFPTDRSESAGESPRVNPPAGFVKDPTVSAQGFPTDRLESAGESLGVNPRTEWVKELTVSASENLPTERLGFDGVSLLQNSANFSKQNELKKDVTVSQPTVGDPLMSRRPSSRSGDNPFSVENTRSSQISFDSQAAFFESAPRSASSVSQARLVPESVQSNQTVAGHKPGSKQQWAQPTANPSRTSIQVDSQPIVRVQPGLRSKSTATAATTVVAAESDFHHVVYPGLIHATLPPSCNCASPVAEFWRPEGMDLPWPPDEYICDGGDADARVTVNRESQVSGLNLEDTVAHYDTEDGRTIVTPSNSVCIYSPRFASVRKIIGVREDDRLLSPGLVDLPLPPMVEDLTRPPLVIEQPLPPRRLLDIDGPLALRDRRRGLEIDQAVRVAELVREFQAYEDYQIMRIGIDKSADKARIIEHITAAIEWSRAEALEVIIDEEIANADTAIQRTGVVYQIKDGPPCLRIIKLANRGDALPGEIVEFTLRYDNIGEQTVENVTVIDNLTTRLEYVPGSSQSDRKAEFFGDENQGESLVLRWEIQEPLQPGDGGLIRFKCKVR